MPIYNKLVFIGTRLLRSETFEADGYLEAIRECSGQHPGEVVELWGEGQRIATLGSSAIQRRLFPLR